MNALFEFLNRLPAALREVGLAGLADMALVTLAVYTFMVVVKRTRRSSLIFTGVVITGVVYLAAQKFDLKLTAALLQAFFAVLVLALVVIFQEDLRYFFERVALWWVERRLPRYKRSRTRPPSRELEILARTLGDLARARIGALVVLRGRDLIARHLVGGEEVDALLSEPLLKSIFDPHSPGHDGAVILENNRLARLGCHLPLSKRLDKLPRSGTRHAAALGLAELSDALCVVVSEERGALSVARHGEITPVAHTSDLLAALERFYREVAPTPTRTPWTDFFRRNYREKAVAFGASVLLWTALVYRSQTIQRSFHVPVTFSLLPAPLTVATCDPPEVRVTFSGERKDFGFLKANQIRLTFELLDAQPGRRTLAIGVRDLSFPEALELEDIAPRKVRVDIRPKTASPTDPIPPK